MQEKPVRKTNWMAVISIATGTWGLLTSFLFNTLFVQPGYIFSLGEGVNDLMLRYYALFGEAPAGLGVSTLFGLAGMLAGIIGLRRGKGVNRLPLAGILLGILVILCGYPSIILMIWIFGA